MLRASNQAFSNHDGPCQNRGRNSKNNNEYFNLKRRLGAFGFISDIRTELQHMACGRRKNHSHTPYVIISNVSKNNLKLVHKSFTVFVSTNLVLIYWLEHWSLRNLNGSQGQRNDLA